MTTRMPGSKLLPMCACAWICHCSTNGINTYTQRIHTKTPMIHALHTIQVLSFDNIPHLSPHIQTRDVSQPKCITVWLCVIVRPTIHDWPVHFCLRRLATRYRSWLIALRNPAQHKGWHWKQQHQKRCKRSNHFEAEHFRVCISWYTFNYLSTIWYSFFFCLLML